MSDRRLRHVETFEFEAPTQESLLTMIRSKLADKLEVDDGAILLSVTPTFDSDDLHQVRAYVSIEAYTDDTDDTDDDTERTI